MPGITAGNRFGGSTCALAVTGGRYSQSRVALAQLGELCVDPLNEFFA